MPECPEKGNNYYISLFHNDHDVEDFANGFLWVLLVCRERFDFDEIGKKLKREIDASNSSSSYHHHQMGRRHMLGPPGTLNTITPCAACKLLRRRCAQECPFSPYFSPHEPQKFASVHKVFGASNVSKMLMVKYCHIYYLVNKIS